MGHSYNLWRGAIGHIYRTGDTFMRPVVQICKLKRSNAKAGERPEFRCIINDGLYYLHATCGTQLSARVLENELFSKALVRLKEFVHCSRVDSETANRAHFLTILDLDVVGSLPRQYGEPARADVVLSVPNRGKTLEQSDDDSWQGQDDGFYVNDRDKTDAPERRALRSHEVFEPPSVDPKLVRQSGDVNAPRDKDDCFDLNFVRKSQRFGTRTFLRWRKVMPILFANCVSSFALLKLRAKQPKLVRLKLRVKPPKLVRLKLRVKPPKHPQESADGFLPYHGGKTFDVINGDKAQGIDAFSSKVVVKPIFSSAQHIQRSGDSNFPDDGDRDIHVDDGGKTTARCTKAALLRILKVKSTHNSVDRETQSGDIRLSKGEAVVDVSNDRKSKCIHSGKFVREEASKISGNAHAASCTTAHHFRPSCISASKLAEAGTWRKRYRVFISHAGPDKQTIAVPLYHLLLEKGVMAFVDIEELRFGDHAPEQMVSAMETADIGVFIASPEFAARQWPMRELRCFLRRKKEATQAGEVGPALIPVFYRLSVEECKDPNLYAYQQNGASVFLAEGFFDPERQRKLSTETMMGCMKELARYTGVENLGGASSEDGDCCASGEESLKRRGSLIRRVMEAVLEAASGSKKRKR